MSDELAFEEALAELEALVRRLEQGELPLEESLAAFERGMALVGQLGSRLDDVSQRVEVLLRAADGTLVTRPARRQPRDSPEPPDARDPDADEE
jgi:exodeoxyribonuclease VII small subunit